MEKPLSKHGHPVPHHAAVPDTGGTATCTPPPQAPTCPRRLLTSVMIPMRSRS